MNEFKHINQKHEDLVTNYLKYIQKQVYVATEDADLGKYDGFSFGCDFKTICYKKLIM